MIFSKQDRKDYAAFLTEEIKKTALQTETIFTNFYVGNLNRDLYDIKKTLN